MKQSIGDFLLRRLQEAGIRHIFGVPGDYNLGLMQQLEDRGERAWIGNCNELNASYATDAYARINGIGAMIVTHGVGTLSAANGIAGAVEKDAVLGPTYLACLAEIQARTAEANEAVKTLKQLLSMPIGYYISIQQLKIDPVWDPIRSNLEFQQLLAGKELIGPNK